VSQINLLNFYRFFFQKLGIFLSIIGAKTTGELTFCRFLSIFSLFLPKVEKFIKNYPVFSLLMVKNPPSCAF